MNMFNMSLIEDSFFIRKLILFVTIPKNNYLY